MTIAASELVDVESLPSPNQLWALEYLFECDWSGGTKLSQSFSTDIQASITEKEQRWGLTRTPYRILTASMLSYDPETAINARNLIMRSGMANWLVPLFPDVTVMTAAGTTTSCPCNTLDRRYFVGARVAIVKFLGQKVSLIQVSKITAVAANALTLADNVGGGFAAGDVVFPLMECDVSLDNMIEVQTDCVLSFTLVATEVQSNASLDPLTAVGAYPSGDSFNGLPLLGIDSNFAGKLKVGVRRAGDFQKIGLANHLQTYGSRPRWIYNLEFLKGERQASADFIRFFEGVGGRLKPFYVVSPVADIKFTSITATTIVRKQAGASIDYANYSLIAVIFLDGTYIIRTITSVSRGSGNDTVNVSSMGSIDSSLIRRVAFVNLCRLDSDELVEEWHTNTAMTTSITCIEVFDETQQGIETFVDFRDGSPSDDGGLVTTQFNQFWYPPVPNILSADFNYLDTTLGETLGLTNYYFNAPKSGNIKKIRYRRKTGANTQTVTLRNQTTAISVVHVVTSVTDDMLEIVFTTALVVSQGDILRLTDNVNDGFLAIYGSTGIAMMPWSQGLDTDDEDPLPTIQHFWPTGMVLEYSDTTTVGTMLTRYYQGIQEVGLDCFGNIFNIPWSGCKAIGFWFWLHFDAVTDVEPITFYLMDSGDNILATTTINSSDLIGLATHFMGTFMLHFTEVTLTPTSGPYRMFVNETPTKLRSSKIVALTEDDLAALDFGANIISTTKTGGAWTNRTKERRMMGLILSEITN